MHISGTTRVFLILGDPVAQVRAPEVFNPLFAQAGIDAVLVPMQVPAGQLDAFVRGVFQARNVDGLWVTIPHKTALPGLLDVCDLSGSTAEAVNAVRRNADGTIEGALFDGIGFAKALDHFGIACTGARVLVVGAGGAGVAIGCALVQRDLAELSIHDVDADRAAAAADRLRSISSVRVSTPPSADPAGHDLVINATPLGLRDDDPMPFDVRRLDGSAAVVDILMKDATTPLLRACAARGITAHAGHEMLIQQVPEYLRFFGFEALARATQADLEPVRALMRADAQAAVPALPRAEPRSAALARTLAFSVPTPTAHGATSPVSLTSGDHP
jgi:shikimate dehydrogenase